MNKKEFAKEAYKRGYAGTVAVEQYIKGKPRNYNYGEDDLIEVYRLQERMAYQYEPNIIIDEWDDYMGGGDN